MRLNSAYCSKEHRKNFVNTYLYGEYVIHSQVPISERSMYNRSSLLSLLMRGEKLQSVRLHRAKITSAQLEIVERHCHQLTQVYLDGGIDRWTLLTVNPHIVRLKITLHFTEKSYKSIPCALLPIPVGTALPKMRLLSINGVSMAGQAELFGLLRSTDGQLITLDLSYCSISLGMLDIVSRLCPQLKTLALAYLFEKERDVAILIFTSRCAHIEHLNIENLGIKNETLLAAVQHLKGLQSLCLRREGYFLADSSLFYI